jgi:hypothetical protein
VNLRYLVPALGILASTSGTAFAANVDGLTVGGFVDTIASVTNTEDDGQRARPAFSAATELRIGYKAGDKVTAQVDVEWNNSTSVIESDLDGDGEDEALAGAGRDVYLEQAYVNYAFADKLSLTTGKFTTYAGWVAADADGLYRINGGPITSLYGGELVGAALNFSASDELGVSLFVVNGLDRVSDASVNGNDNNRVSPAIDIVYKLTDVGSFNIEGGYDSLSEDSEELSLGVNATIKLASYQPLTLGAEAIWRSVNDDAAVGAGAAAETSGLGFLLMVNHTIPGAPFPMSGTLMGQHVITEAENTGGTTIEDSNVTELSFALLTNPTGDSHFGLNAEVFYTIESDDLAAESDDVNSLGVALEAIAVIP